MGIDLRESIPRWLGWPESFTQELDGNLAGMRHFRLGPEDVGAIRCQPDGVDSYISVDRAVQRGGFPELPAGQRVEFVQGLQEGGFPGHHVRAWAGFMKGVPTLTRTYHPLSSTGGPTEYMLVAQYYKVPGELFGESGELWGKLKSAYLYARLPDGTKNVLFFGECLTGPTHRLVHCREVGSGISSEALTANLSRWGGEWGAISGETISLSLDAVMMRERGFFLGEAKETWLKLFIPWPTAQRPLRPVVLRRLFCHAVENLRMEGDCVPAALKLGRQIFRSGVSLASLAPVMLIGLAVAIS